MNVCAFIFARGGSKGLPGKNILPLGGLPLLAHSINMARGLNAVSQIYVSTDSDEIADVARQYSAEVIMRPAELATDTASEWLAWRHAIGSVRAEGISFDTFLSLPATSPLRARIDVERCLVALDERTDIVVTATPASRNPYFNMVSRDGDGNSQLIFSNREISRRQDAPEFFDLTTVAYVARPDFIMSSYGIFSGVVRSVLVPKERSIDIDDAFDFAVAEALWSKLNE